MKTKKNKLDIISILTIFIFIQPIIDLITSLTVRYTDCTITLGIVLRSFVMLLSTFYVIFKIPKNSLKKFTVLFYIIFLIYIIAFLINSIYYKGFGSLFYECKGIIKTFYLPIILLSYINIFKYKKTNIDSTILNKVILLYSIMIFIPTCIGIYCYSYNDINIGLGTVGLFYSANEVGGIIGILLIYVLNDFIYGKFDVKNLISLQLLLFSVFYLGTKVPVFAFILCLLFMLVINILRLILDKKNKEDYKKILKKMAIMVIIIIPVVLPTPFVKNFSALSDQLSFINASLNPVDIKKTTKKVKPRKEKIKEYTEVIVSGRNFLLKNSRAKYNDSTISTKLLGYGYVDNNNGKYVNIKTVEMDYFDIFFSQGLIGFVIFFLSIIIIGFICLKAIILNIKNFIFNNKMLVDFFAIVIGLAISLVAGHILVSPAVNIYLVIIFTRLFLNIKNNKEFNNE